MTFNNVCINSTKLLQTLLTNISNKVRLKRSSHGHSYEDVNERPAYVVYGVHREKNMKKEKTVRKNKTILYKSLTPRICDAFKNGYCIDFYGVFL